MAETFKAIFMGGILRKTYYLDDRRGYDGRYLGEPTIRENFERAGSKKFYEFDLEKPPLEAGERLYINELDLTIYINDRVRSTNGEYVYYSDYNVETIEDEKTERTLKKAKEELTKAMIEYNEYLEKEKKKNQPKKKWYHFFK